MLLGGWGETAASGRSEMVVGGCSPVWWRGSRIQAAGEEGGKLFFRHIFGPKTQLLPLQALCIWPTPGEKMGHLRRLPFFPVCLHILNRNGKLQSRRFTKENYSEILSCKKCMHKIDH